MQISSEYLHFFSLSFYRLAYQDLNIYLITFYYVQGVRGEKYINTKIIANFMSALQGYYKWWLIDVHYRQHS